MHQFLYLPCHMGQSVICFYDCTVLDLLLLWGITNRHGHEKYSRNIPILPEAFLTFVSKKSIGPSYTAHGPHPPWTLYAMKWGYWPKLYYAECWIWTRGRSWNLYKPQKAPPPYGRGLIGQDNKCGAVLNNIVVWWNSSIIWITLNHTTCTGGGGKNGIFINNPILISFPLGYRYQGKPFMVSCFWDQD